MLQLAPVVCLGEEVLHGMVHGPECSGPGYVQDDLCVVVYDRQPRGGLQLLQLGIGVKVVVEGSQLASPDVCEGVYSVEVVASRGVRVVFVSKEEPLKIHTINIHLY